MSRIRSLPRRSACFSHRIAALPPSAGRAMPTGAAPRL